MAALEERADAPEGKAVRPSAVGETPAQFTRTLVFFAALRAALDEGCSRDSALDFARGRAVALDALHDHPVVQGSDVHGAIIAEPRMNPRGRAYVHHGRGADGVRARAILAGRPVG